MPKKKKKGAMPKQPAPAKRAKTTATTSTAAAAAGGDDDDDGTFNTLAKQVASTHLAQQDDCMQGTKENQSAYVAAVAQVTQLIARKLKLRPHDIREQVKEQRAAASEGCTPSGATAARRRPRQRPRRARRRDREAFGRKYLRRPRISRAVAVHFRSNLSARS